MGQLSSAIGLFSCHSHFAFTLHSVQHGAIEGHPKSGIGSLALSSMAFLLISRAHLLKKIASGPGLVGLYFANAFSVYALAYCYCFSVFKLRS